MDAERIAAVIGGLFRFSNSAAGWLLTYALHSTVWLVAAWFITTRRLLRDAPALQHAVWTVSMVAGFATASLQLMGALPSLAPALRVADSVRHSLGAIVVDERQAEGMPAQVHVGTVRPLELAEPVGGALRREIFVADRLISSRFSPSDFIPANLGTHRETVFRTTVMTTPLSVVVLLPMLLVSGILLAGLALSRVQLRNMMHGAADANASPAGIALRHLARAARVTRPLSVVVTDAVSAPAAVSTSQIALPSRVVAELTPLEQEGVIAHELAHLVRRDTFWLRVALVIERVAWFQPLNRLARRRMQLAAEFAADAWAVRLTRAPIGLAQTLARIATWMVGESNSRADRRLRTVLGADGSPLLQRVQRLTAPDVTKIQRTCVWEAVSLLAITTLALLAVLPSVSVGLTSTSVLGAADHRELRFVLRRDVDLAGERPVTLPFNLRVKNN